MLDIAIRKANDLAILGNFIYPENLLIVFDYFSGDSSDSSRSFASAISQAQNGRLMHERDFPCRTNHAAETV